MRGGVGMYRIAGGGTLLHSSSQPEAKPVLLSRAFKVQLMPECPKGPVTTVHAALAALNAKRTCHMILWSGATPPVSQGS